MPTFLSREYGSLVQVTPKALFGVGAPEAVLVGVVALVVFGPKGLAEVSFCGVMLFPVLLPAACPSNIVPSCLVCRLSGSQEPGKNAQDLPANHQGSHERFERTEEHAGGTDRPG